MEYYFQVGNQISTCLFSFSSGFFVFSSFSSGFFVFSSFLGDLTVRKMYAPVISTLAWLLINAKWDKVINPRPQFLYM